MAEDQQSDLERTEPASPRRLEQAREQGQVARSLELTTFLMVMIPGVLLLTAGAGIVDGLQTLVRHALAPDRAVMLDPAAALAQLRDLFAHALLVIAPLLGASLLVALVAPMLLSGWLFSPQALEPRASRMSPLAWVSRTFSWQGAIELAKAVLKTVLLGGVLVAVLWDQAETFALLAAQPLPSALVDMVGLLRAAFVAVMLVLLLVVVIDVPFQLWQHAKQLRMTREEVRKEARETEGSPELRGRIRQLQREMARRRMMAEVPRADVVVTNPTHYAVALRYQEGRMRAPEVVAKGAREVAERILETAREHSVPVLQAPPLARALHRHAELGEAVPAALYGAVAEVLAWVYQLRLARDYGVAAPARPEELEVPAELDPGPDADADAGALAPVAGRAMTGAA